MCTTNQESFEESNPKQPTNITLITTLSRLLEHRLQDMRTYNELDELAVKVHDAHDTGNRPLLSKLLTQACDLEYGLMCDCDVFGDLAQQWRVDDAHGEAMYVVPDPDC
jgi:hypothetical protein